MKLNIQLFAHTNATTNYELPQFIGTDKPTWLGDFNEAMADIDAGMHENASDIASMASDVSTATAAASQASTDVSALTGTVNTLSSTVSSVQTTANNASQTASSALNTANTANGKADTNASAITTLSGTVTTLSGDFEDSIEYSTTEQVIGKWIDGKPIYRKVITFGALPNHTTKTIAHNISNLGETIRLYGIGFRTSDHRSLTIPDPDPNAEIACNSTISDINIATQSDRSTFNDSFICIEYTKSTD